MTQETSSNSSALVQAIRSVWGFRRLRPLQLEAMNAELAHRDSLVVMPTGGGKSLCYQAPPLVAQRTDVVVSPLISLMKDQVDGLREVGYPAAALYSGLGAAERRRVEEDLVAGKLRLIFASPERLSSRVFLNQLKSAGVQSFAIDEAHCISHWGHDFRPEYRQLAALRRHFPASALHAYTATATERVRQDIAAQLELRDPVVLVGTFDRPNLQYRVIPRVDAYAQTLKIIQRHADEAVIVYCISRRDTEAMSDFLVQQRVRAAAYHAGMDAEDRRRTQDAFLGESLEVIVATVAFGMGIDRSNVRCVIHAGLPKSVEHYQQESGRAGRDGLPAECVLLYSHSDVERWKSLFTRNLVEGQLSQEALDVQVQMLEHIRHYAAAPKCRHRALSEHFGQKLESASCEACDVCLGEIEGLADSTVAAQKILSCVARVQERFGVGHVADVLLGAGTERVCSLNHHRLSTFGLMKELDKKAITNLVHQLVDLGLLDRTAEERPILKLNPESWRILRGERTVNLQQPARKAVKSSREDDSWEGVDRGLFDSLRALRRTLAEERAVPPYVIFSDATLRDLARVRPGSRSAMTHCYGVGQRKLADLGDAFVSQIQSYCAVHGLSLDNLAPVPASRRRYDIASRSATDSIKSRAIKMLQGGTPIDVVMEAAGRARSTVVGYVVELIESQTTKDGHSWIDDRTLKQVIEAAHDVGAARLRPIYEHLGERVSFEEIRIALAVAKTQGVEFATAG